MGLPVFATPIRPLKHARSITSSVRASAAPAGVCHNIRVALLANLPIKVVQHLITRQHLGNAARSADDHLDKKRNTPMTISGRTKLIAHLGYPTESFKAPMI